MQPTCCWAAAACPRCRREPSNPGSLILVIPEDTAAGTWYLIAKADAEARVSETVETNNTVARSIKIGADLTVSAVSAPTVAGAGQSVTITDTTKNQGGGTAGPSTTRYYLSADTTLGRSGRVDRQPQRAGTAGGGEQQRFDAGDHPARYPDGQLADHRRWRTPRRSLPKPPKPTICTGGPSASAQI